LAPIEVRGQHLYDSKTGKQFHAKGIGFPNVGKDADVSEWIRVLQRIHHISKHINVIRIYEPPNCAADLNSICFKPFMREADRLGVYVVIAGSGTLWGYFPATPAACGGSLQGCYEVGGILGFGINIVRNFNYPNTLAITIANEIEQNLQALPVLKAYARDLKSYMGMCNSNTASPTRGSMRQIPLIYSATDTGGSFLNEADYLFCDEESASIDIFGLNIERWISDEGGRQQYDMVNAGVKAKHWPGAFLHSEEGGPYGKPFPAVPTWDQIPGFFSNWPAIDGFMAYAYHGGNPQFNMFDGNSADSEELPDGKAFFGKMELMRPDPVDQAVESSKRPVCKTSLVIGTTSHDMVHYDIVKTYDTGPNAWAINCPKPWQESNTLNVFV